MSGQDKESKQAQTDRHGTTSKRNFFQPLLLDEDHGICYRKRERSLLNAAVINYTISPNAPRYFHPPSTGLSRPSSFHIPPYSAARPKEKLELSSTLVAGFSLGKYRKMERESELCIYLSKVSSSITYYTSCAYSNKTKNNGYWMGRGARALENPHTATGEESLEKLYALLDDLRGGGVRSQAFLSLQSKGHGLIMRVVFYHGVGSQIFMDSFFITEVDPKGIMSQNEEAIEKLFFIFFVSNFMKNSILSLPRYEQKSGAALKLYTPFVLRTFVDSELCSRRNQTFDGPALFYAQLYPERKMSFSPLGARRSRGSGEGKKTHPLLHLARDDKERASSIDEQRIDEALGIALFFSPFLSVSSDPFVRNFFVRTESLAESNPVPQDPISAIHPPCIYAGDVASAMGFGLCR
ncbi:hypothetical protein V6N11_018348 [Hibiscus sabdariffa]|uniref:DUF8018 domain-containing protein n=1 Tax=Hibiscus sabdariffa TaxID=183260 RepID=A0ABR2T749_9ROSI